VYYFIIEQNLVKPVRNELTANMCHGKWQEYFATTAVACGSAFGGMVGYQLGGSAGAIGGAAIGGAVTGAIVTWLI